MFDDLPVEIVCPNCGKKIQQTLGWFKRQKPSCPICSAWFDTRESIKAIKELEKEYQKTIQEIAKTITLTARF
jgi:transcription initiation factor IIE alpha subunit